MKKKLRIFAFLLCALLLATAAAAKDPATMPDSALNPEGKIIFNVKYAHALLDFFASLRQPFVSKKFDELDARSDYRSLYLHLLADTNYPADPFIDSPEGVLLWNSLKLYYGNKTFLDAYVRALQYVEKNALINRYKTWIACKKWFEDHSKKFVDFLDTYEKGHAKAQNIAKEMFRGIQNGTETTYRIATNRVIERAGLQKIHGGAYPLTPEMRNTLQDLDNHVNAVRNKSDEFKKQGEELLALTTAALWLHDELEAYVRKEAAKGNANQSLFGQKVMIPDRRVLERLAELAHACIETYSYFEKDENTLLIVSHEIARKYPSLGAYSFPNISYVDKFKHAHRYLDNHVTYLNDLLDKARESRKKN